MKFRIALYTIVCVMSSIICFYCNLPYYAEGPMAFKDFWIDAFANGASSSITWDLGFVTVLVFYWMYVEAKKWNIKYIWIYYLVVMGIALAPPLSFFLIVRERRKAESEATS